MRNTIFTFILIILTSAVIAGVPQTINYQGRLTNSPSGTPVTGIKSMTFTIYDADTGGDSKWTETHPTVSVVDGLFNVILGAGTPAEPVEDTVFSGANRWLEIIVSGGTITPRTKLASTPYAFRVATVDGSSGGIISGDVSIQSDLAVSGKATIGPGHTNTGAYAFVAGQNNSATDDWATVSGGTSNTASHEYSTVGGGVSNTASGWKSTVSGGDGNEATNYYSVVSGGYRNTANAIGSTVSGGQVNTTSSTNSTVGGGAYNIASGGYSTVPGGYYNYAVGQNAFAAGRKAKANHDGAFVWADHTDADFASTAADQFLIRANGGVGIGTTSPQETLDVNGSVQMNGFKMPGGQAGHVLTSDASGGGTWQPPAAVSSQDVFRRWGSFQWAPADHMVIPSTCSYTHIITGITIAGQTVTSMNLWFYLNDETNVISLASTIGGVSWSSGGGAPIVIPAGMELWVGNILGRVHITITGYHQ